MHCCQLLSIGSVSFVRYLNIQCHHGSNPVHCKELFSDLSTFPKIFIFRKFFAGDVVKYFERNTEIEQALRNLVEC